ncbi:MAG: hypothetical protein ACKVS8_01840 [Phycisphaerales bacterium]
MQDVRKVRDALWAQAGFDADVYWAQSQAFAAKLRAQGYRFVEPPPRADRPAEP